MVIQRTFTAFHPLNKVTKLISFQFQQSVSSQSTTRSHWAPFGVKKVRFWPLNFSHVIDSEKTFDGVKELIESVILSPYSMGLSTKTYV